MPVFLIKEDSSISIESKMLVAFNGQQVPAGNYHPVWLNNLADDVMLEGSAMNGVAQGAEAVRSIVPFIRTLYERQEFNIAGPYGENGSSRTIPPGSAASRSATWSSSPAPAPGKRRT
jgi:hypothetical protein